MYCIGALGQYTPKGWQSHWLEPPSLLNLGCIEGGCKMPNDSGGDFFARPFVECADQLTGDENQNDAHLVVRAAFLNCLVHDERIKSLFEDWGNRTGLFREAEKIRSSVHALAASCGFEDDLEFVRQFFLDGKDPKDDLVDLTQLKNASAGFFTAMNKFGKLCKNSGRELGESLLIFVRDDLKLPFPWIPIELVHVFYLRLITREFGFEFEIQFTLRGPALSEDFRFEAVADELISEIWARMLSEFEKAVVASIAPVGKESRAAKNRGQHLEKYAEWFYRKKVNKESIRAIAQDYCLNNCQVLHSAENDHR